MRDNGTPLPVPPPKPKADHAAGLAVVLALATAASGVLWWQRMQRLCAWAAIGTSLPAAVCGVLLALPAFPTAPAGFKSLAIQA